jgi:hypothetical protein
MAWVAILDRARDPRAKTKRTLRHAKRNETKRIPGRKSLESLSALNRSFRGIVCLQWVNRRFISRFFTYRSRVECEAGLM